VFFRAGSRCVVLAASGRDRAEAYARVHGIQPRLVLEKQDLLVSPRQLRKRIRDAHADAVVVHSMSWGRQRSPQVFELALALTPLCRRLIADEETGVVQALGAGRLAARLVRLPSDPLRNAAVISGEALRLVRRGGPTPANVTPSGTPSVLALWPGSAQTFGGALTHIEGILGGFRRAGLRVGLLTRVPLPERLQAVVDDVEVAPPLSEASRLTWDTEQLGANASLRRAGLALARRLEPSFVYQRHCPFLLAGADLAESLRVPLVLEWNGSELWIRRNWQSDGAVAHRRVSRLLDPLVGAMERNVVSRAALVCAVSQVAADMATAAGADPSKAVVVPNAVDIDSVDAALAGTSGERDRPGVLLGWAGSFGPWHGAEMAVRALGKLPAEISLRMIGAGNEWEACRRLAESLGVADRVEMTGALPRSLALQKLSECDLLLSPHTPLRDQPFFGSPTKIFEYMALGKPIVVSRLGQLGELFEDGVNARLVTPGDVDDLADAVMSVVRSPDRGRALGEAARRMAEREHTWDTRARTLVEAVGLGVDRAGVAEPA
jgi:glycosyltransferase involved in cell wall biosynthesis